MQRDSIGFFKKGLSLMTKSVQGLCHGRFAKTRFCFTYKNKELDLSLFLARPSLGSGSLFVNSLRPF